MKFRKKPVVIEATQWFKNGDHPGDYAKDDLDHFYDPPRVISAQFRKVNNWEGKVVRYYRHPDTARNCQCDYCGRPLQDHGWIDTDSGGHKVCPGDWVITGTSGEVYPCKPDIFKDIYEKVEDGPQ